ncbi:aerobic-type carbon monoxide dehydrogenase small subunit (CoxS/CutS family) [Bradyrhizobium diazoefficiens]
MANLTINGKSLTLDVEPDTPLLWAIRENAGLTGTKYGCGIAQCGACTVHIDGIATRACGVSVAEAEGKKITTCRKPGSPRTFRNAAIARVA